MHLAWDRRWPVIRRPASAVLGPPVRTRPCISACPMPTSARSVFRRWPRRASVTPRTAVYGPVRTVVWQGSAGNRCPMPIKCRFVAIPIMWRRSQRGPSGFSAPRPLHNISCFGLLYSRDGYSIPNFGGRKCWISFLDPRAVVQRHLGSPLLQERLEYLQHCANQGYSLTTLRELADWSEDKGLMTFLRSL